MLNNSTCPNDENIVAVANFIQIYPKGKIKVNPKVLKATFVLIYPEWENKSRFKSIAEKTYWQKCLDLFQTNVFIELQFSTWLD